MSSTKLGAARNEHSKAFPSTSRVKTRVHALIVFIIASFSLTEGILWLRCRPPPQRNCAVYNDQFSAKKDTFGLLFVALALGKDGGTATP